ncbi:MAG: hypothetical protein LBC30_03670 [Puniceicoccales bacterium]|jgi:hypothetical protein|nr:hypothetical protein [Puniceicoccales bacterium]
MNSLFLNVASLFIPKPLDGVVRFYNKNKFHLDGCASELEKLLKVISIESSDPRALRSTIAGLNQLAKNQALRELSTRATSTFEDDFIQKAGKAVETHVKKESTKRDLSFLIANFKATARELKVSISPCILSPVAVSMVVNQIDTFFEKIDTIFGNKFKP